MEQTDPRRLQCLETVPMEEEKGGEGEEDREEGGRGKGAVSGVFSASSVLKEISQRKHVSIIKSADV